MTPRNIWYALLFILVAAAFSLPFALHAQTASVQAGSPSQPAVSQTAVPPVAQPGAPENTSPSQPAVPAPGSAVTSGAPTEKKETAPANAHAPARHASYTVSPLMTLPFVLLLLSIAVMPFINKHFWEHNYHWFSYILGAIVVVYYVFSLGAPVKVLHTFYEYVSFICLIGSLFVVTGGIVIKLRNEGNPVVNSAVLFIGAIIANIIGTTGASMLLIRPFIRINHRRIRPYLVVFFIFVVSNVGGALTPIGDPPLFLGYLQGIPFFWVIENVVSMWGVAIGLIIATFFAIDYYFYAQDKFAAIRKKVHAIESAHGGGHGHHEPSTVVDENSLGIVRDANHLSSSSVGAEKTRLQKKKKHHDAKSDGLISAEDETLALKLYGISNFVFLFIILVAVFIPAPWREFVMAACAIGAYKTTPKKYHDENGFNFDPIKEVAILFVGIFATMIPALDWLEANASTLGVTTPGHFYWGSGVLSSFLDNAPTYLNFLSAAKGLNGVTAAADLLKTPELAKYVVAISLGSVFFGANTYIGNGPNFMVKNIAEQMKVEMPSFFGYIFHYSLPILVPVFAVVWAVFLR